MNHGKITEFVEIFSHTTFEIFSAHCVRNWSLSFHIDHGKCSENHGKIMEFLFGKWLETLILKHLKKGPDWTRHCLYMYMLPLNI